MPRTFGHVAANLYEFNVDLFAYQLSPASRTALAYTHPDFMYEITSDAIQGAGGYTYHALVNKFNAIGRGPAITIWQMPRQEYNEWMYLLEKDYIEHNMFKHRPLFYPTFHPDIHPLALYFIYLTKLRNNDWGTLGWEIDHPMDYYTHSWMAHGFELDAQRRHSAFVTADGIFLREQYQVRLLQPANGGIYQKHLFGCQHLQYEVKTWNGQNDYTLTVVYNNGRFTSWYMANLPYDPAIQGARPSPFRRLFSCSLCNRDFLFMPLTRQSPHLWPSGSFPPAGGALRHPKRMFAGFALTTWICVAWYRSQLPAALPPPVNAVGWPPVFPPSPGFRLEDVISSLVQPHVLCRAIEGPQFIYKLPSVP
ncbi:hypothetical protein TruAng_006163 [Truncatella angustata]|nr:hypothetical protein TruAng_006163 [Truncatella angustata]